jgi:hypothetical protein
VNFKLRLEEAAPKIMRRDRAGSFKLRCVAADEFAVGATTRDFFFGPAAYALSGPTVPLMLRVIYDRRARARENENISTRPDET